MFNMVHNYFDYKLFVQRYIVFSYRASLLRGFFYGKNPRINTICPGSSDLFYIVCYYIKWVTTSWTHGRIRTEIIHGTTNQCMVPIRDADPVFRIRSDPDLVLI